MLVDGIHGLHCNSQVLRLSLVVPPRKTSPCVLSWVRFPLV